MTNRLWIVQRAYTPRKGGASRRIQELAWAMQQDFGWDVTLLSCKTNETPSDGVYQDVRVRIAGNNPLSLVGRWQYILHILYLLRAERSSGQVVHINAPFLESGFLVRYCRTHNIRVALQLTMEGQDDPFSLARARKYPGFLSHYWMDGLSEADAIFGMSPALCNLCVKFGWDSRRIYWSPHGKDVNLFRPAVSFQEQQQIRQAFGLPLDKKLVGFVGFLSQRKGFRELVEAWCGLVKDISQAHLVIAGDYSVGQEMWAANFLDLLPRETFTYLGVLAREQVACLLRCLDLFVLPSKAEGMSGVLVEAILSGVPCIATFLPGSNDRLVQSEVTGLLVPPGDSASLQVGLRLLLQPDGLLSQLKGGRDRLLPDFDAKVVFAAYDSFYRLGRVDFRQV